MRKCAICGIDKSFDNFYKNSWSRNGIRQPCKDCNLVKEQRERRAVREAKRRPTGEGMKWCSLCGVEKELSCFYRHKTTADGRQTTCIQCILARSRKKRKAERELGRPKATFGMKWCGRCNFQKILSSFSKDRKRKDGYYAICKTCVSKQRVPNQEIKLMGGARDRARARGLPCTITPKDIIIPTHCPILGIEIKRSETGHVEPYSPSLDCIFPKLGYVPGNIAVISHRANCIKSDANIEELESVLRWFKQKDEEAFLRTVAWG